MRASRLVLMLLLAAVLLVGCRLSGESAENGSNVLIHFDRQDYERADELVSRFHKGQHDYLLAVMPTVEGGPIIYDLYSDGRQIRVTRDDSRDVYGASPKKQTYVCRGAGWKREDGEEKLVLSECEGIDGDWALLRFEG